MQRPVPKGVQGVKVTTSPLLLQCSAVFNIPSVAKYQNKTGTSKVGAISKAQKAQKTFFEKNLKFLIFFFQKMSHSAEKCKRGTLWALLTYILLQNIKKLKRGTLLRHEKNFEKSRTVPKKIERGDPLVSSGFVGYVKKVKNEGGTLCTKFALAGLGLNCFISFCKKLYIRDEVCGLTKKKLATVRVGHFSLEKRRLKNERRTLWRH